MRAAEQLQATADAVLARRAAVEPSIALGQGRPVRGLATLDPARLDADAAFFTEARHALTAIEAQDLSPAQDCFRTALSIDLANRAESARHRGLDFVLAPYMGGDLHVESRQALAAHPLASASDREAYVELLLDYARLLREMLAHSERQQANGAILAAPALPAARSAMRGLIDSLPAAAIPAAARLATIPPAAQASLHSAVVRVVQQDLLPPLRRLADMLDAQRLPRDPEVVGLHRQPGGLACYRHLIRRHTDCALEPEDIHRIGLESLERLRDARAALRSRLMPGVDEHAFDLAVRSDARWQAATPADIERCFTAHVQRVESELPRWFGRLPEVPWAVTRADPAFEAGMTFGYFQRATPADPVGRYRYNGSDPGARSLIGAGHLICHELLPGHHLQLSLQDQAPLAHPLQRFLVSTATVEGWAVYASELACEMGALSGFDRYGHLQMQAFLAARLVVDTGLNAMGWTLEQARHFMRDHTIESGGTIDSELLRYSTDIPAQALAYELGHRGIERLRHQARDALGSAFDVRQFHDTLLVHGGYPLPVLQQQVERWTIDAGGRPS